jgi:ComF family protein
MHTVKYHGHFPAGALLGEILATFLKERVEKGTLIIPIPLSKNRFRSRGYNQVSYILEHAIYTSPSLQHHVCNALRRVRNTPSQTTLNKNDRSKNVYRVFTALPSVKGAHVILIDDVVTTGSTLLEARRELLQAGAVSVRLVACAG